MSSYKFTVLQRWYNICRGEGKKEKRKTSVEKDQRNEKKRLLLHLDLKKRRGKNQKTF